MDPNANLKEQLEIARDIIKTWDDSNADEVFTVAVRVADRANRLAELVETLDEWIRKGGFLPARWNNNAQGVSA